MDALGETRRAARASVGCMLNRRLQELLYEHDHVADLDGAARRLALRDLVIKAGEPQLLDHASRVLDEIDGFGPISELMQEGGVTDILINGPADVRVQRGGLLQETDVAFDDVDHLAGWVERLVVSCGGRLDLSSPIADARLPDGSRLHVVIPPIAPEGPLVSIRRFPSTPFRLEDLVSAGSLSAGSADRLAEAVSAGRSLLIAGPTGAGKTTLMAALLQLVRPVERVVVIEELPELRFGSNCVSLIARKANAEGRGAVSLDELVRAALRMRPDRIVIGEVRGSEALPALAAMATGHRGSMLTIHAEDPQGALDRLVNLALQAPGAPSEVTLVRQARLAIDGIVQLHFREGSRIVSELAEL